MNPSYQHYATHDESEYPELWDGCIGAWAPCLGPTGTRLHDLSGRSNWGTLTSMDAATDWVVDGGRFGLDFDASNDYINLGTAQFVTIGQPYTLSWWEKITSSANTYQSRFSLSAGGTIRLAVLRTKDASYSPLAFGYAPGTGAQSTVPSAPSVVSSAGVWNHFVISAQSFGQTIADLCVVNGRSLTVGFPAPGLVSLPNNGFGWDGVDGGAEAIIDDVRLYSRKLTIAECRLLYSGGFGRGIAYTPSRRRKAYFLGPAFNPAWARGANQFVQPSMIGVA